MSNAYLSIDYARFRTYPYPTEEAREFSMELLSGLNPSQPISNDRLPLPPFFLPGWDELLDSGIGPWVRENGRVMLNRDYLVEEGARGSKSRWVGSEASRSTQEALYRFPNIHGLPGDYTIDNDTNFTTGYKDSGTKGEELTALLIAHYASGLPLLNSVMWPRMNRRTLILEPQNRQYDDYDFDHMITAGNRIAIVDAKLLHAPGVVTLYGPNDLPVEAKTKWLTWKNGKRQQARNTKASVEQRGDTYGGQAIVGDAYWDDVWDGLVVNKNLMQVSPLDGIRKVEAWFDQMGLVKPEVRVFTALSTSSRNEPRFEVVGSPTSVVGSPRDMVTAAVDWVNEPGEGPRPGIVSLLHSRLKHSTCSGGNCEYSHATAA